METGIFSGSKSMSGYFVCFLEEESAKEMLSVLIPKLTGIDKGYVRPFAFRGKQDLQKQIKGKLANYKVPNCVFLVMCDKDQDDCKNLKSDLQSMVARNKIDKTKIRIVCQELESFYLGDLKAVEQGIGVSNLSQMQNQIPYRTPDDSVKPSKLLKKITENKYQKVRGSRNIAPHLSLDDSNKSHSFNMLISAIKELHQTLQQNANS